MVEVIAVIMGLFKFWDEVVQVINMLRQTPDEQHAAIMAKVKDVFDEKKNNGRPTWDDP